MIISDIDGTLFDNHQRKDLLPDNRHKTENWAEFNAAHVSDTPITHRIQMLDVMATHRRRRLHFWHNKKPITENNNQGASNDAT